ncbi:MAG: T9SS type A sorting domain-containing protein [Clostridia bacterium]|nr:T9SS type A sorting domain-containing protein [Clostridia bacterium]
MKKFIILALFSCLTLATRSNPLPAVDTSRINGTLVLTVLFSDPTMGLDYGYLLGDRLYNVLENYVVNTAFGGAASYNYARQIFDQRFVVSEYYTEFATNMILGMTYGGFQVYSPTLGREFTYQDVLLANAIPDMTAFGLTQTTGPGCSDLMSWGTATANDPQLNGGMVICRNLDWDDDPLLIENALITVWFNEGFNQRIVTFGFVGMIGALSGMNDDGIATFQNMGNYSSSPVGTGFYPVNLAQRDGLEHYDFNGDGICSPRDVTDAVRSHPMAATFIINTVGPTNLEFPAEILEIHNTFGDTIRTAVHNPEFFGDNLVSTNHFRLLKNPSYCARYNRISDSIQASTDFTIARNWRVLQTAGVPGNLQTIQFIPATKLIRFSMARPGTPAYQIEPTEVSMYGLPVSIIEHAAKHKGVFSVAPNPCRTHTNLLIAAATGDRITIEISDANGNSIYTHHDVAKADGDNNVTWNTSHYPSGVYLCKVLVANNKTRKNVSEVQKILVLK